MVYMSLIAVAIFVSMTVAVDIGPVEYLYKYRYLKVGRSSAKDIAEALRKLQKLAHIPVTGILDDRTREVMRRPRCGVADDNILTYGVSSWAKTSLTYRFENHSPDLGVSATRAIIARAFQVWADVTPLRFFETAGPSDLSLRFEGFQHGTCSYPFDGVGGVLAHAFFPPDGRTHFDESETFTDWTHDGTNLFFVAAHEFGHALGLSHSDAQEALMYPFYRGYQADFKLSNNDITRIQALYGSRPLPTARPPCDDDRVHGTDCAYYVRNGFCKTHPGQMAYYCKLSCGWC